MLPNKPRLNSSRFDQEKPPGCPAPCDPGVSILSTGVSLLFPFDGVMQMVLSSVVGCAQTGLLESTGETFVSIRRTDGTSDPNGEIDRQRDHADRVRNSAEKILTAMCTYCIDNQLYLGE